MKHYEYLDLTIEQRETQPRDGMEWADLKADDDYYTVYDLYNEQADGISDLEHADDLDFTYIDSDGVKHYVEVRVKDEPETPQSLAEKSGKSVRTVYNLAKKLGRLPTVEELNEERKKTGRPRKYNY